MLRSWGLLLLLLGTCLPATAGQGGKDMDKAIFAGGCFWCMTPPFEKVEGVVKVTSGYTDGKGSNPTYEDYAEKGYTEAVEVTFDPRKVTYEGLLDVFWRQIDPTDPNGQFVDRGPAYRAAVFYLDDAQRRAAEASKKALGESGRFKKPILTPIRPAAKFYPAEDYHQDFYKKSPVRYEAYHAGSGRPAFLKKVWGAEKHDAAPRPPASVGKPSEADLRKQLSPMQYKVTQQAATEPPFHNEYWDNHKDGIYVDVVTGEPLFSSRDKFDSGTGWPCFTQALEGGMIVERPDHSLGMERTEVRAKGSGSHLGHLFEDGPAPLHTRYCINSAALRFVPKEELEKEGLGRYLKLFER